MTNPEKNFFFQLASNLIAVLLGAFLASFVFSFLMDGIWAFVLAMVGGVASSIFLRFIKIRMKTMLPGLVIGYIAGLVIPIWAGRYWNLSVNLWVSAVYVFTLGIVRTFISDDLLANWINKIFAKQDVQNKP